MASNKKARTRRFSEGLNVNRLEELIENLGVRVKVYKSSICPNMKSLESLDHNVNCTVCNNNMIDFDPVCTVAMFQQQDFQESFKFLGTYNVDEVMVTFPANITLQMFTKVELLDFSEDFMELIQRQEGSDIDLLKYPACEVLGVFVIRSNQKVRFHLGADFEIDSNGSIKWIGSHKPNDREIYTIYYRYKPVYRAIKAVHRDRFTQYNLRPDQIKSPKKTIDGSTYVKAPETWILKRDYLLERRDKDGNLLSDNTYYDPNETP